MDGSFQAVRAIPGVTLRSRAVLAYAAGLDVAELAPLVRSLRAVFSGQVILAVDRRPTLIAWLGTHDVEAVVVPRARPWSDPYGLARWAFCEKVLTSRPEIKHVLTVDPSDVVFQDDPFAHVPTRLQFVEDAGRPARLALMRDLIGDALADKIGSEAPVLTDVIAGPSADVVRFCGSMQRLSLASRTVPGGPTALEQGVCTVIARLGLDGGQVLSGLDLVAVAGERHRIIDGRVSHPRGSSCAIVLGWQQHPLLARHVAQSWGVGPIRRPGLVAKWQRVWQALRRSLERALTVRPTPQRVLAPTTARSRRSSERMVAASSVSSVSVERAASESA